MLDKIKRLIKEANEADLQGNFELGDYLDDIIKNALEIDMGNAGEDTARLFFQNKLGLPGGFGSPNYESDGRYTVSLNCKTDEDLKYLQDLLSRSTKEECTLDTECTLKEPTRIGTILYDKIKLQKFGDKCVLSLIKRNDDFKSTEQ